MRTLEPGPGAASRGRRLPSLLLPLVLAAALAGCSEDPDAATGATDEPSASESSDQPGDLPRCEDVWVDGETLPGGYRGCVDGDTMVDPQGRPCSFGKPLLTHEDRFWSVRDGRITATDEARLLDDPRYRQVLETCTG